ncbi:hypothetical protein BH09ACT5_BH09ACT5_05240 [soil metagenome]
MIAWWGWLLIWTGLVLALLVSLALLLWWLFRKAMALLDDVGELAGTAEVLAVDDVELPEPAIAVLAASLDIRAREDARRSHRALRRSERHARRMARARSITTVDASKRQWPSDWY